MNRNGWLGLSLIASAISVVGAEPLELTASKDTFGRSNERNRNSGGSEFLLIAQAPSVRTLVAFDLSTVTNEISGAEFRFRPHKSSPNSVNVVVAPMVNTANNTAWGEGRGNLGVQGQNSLSGEACYAFSAFRDVPWESAPGVPVVNLGDSKLWRSPFIVLKGITWEEGGWIHISIKDTALLEQVRNSKTPEVTFGVWGEAGNGLYYISSKDSNWPPVLLLNLKENGGE